MLYPWTELGEVDYLVLPGSQGWPRTANYLMHVCKRGLPIAEFREGADLVVMATELLTMTIAYRWGRHCILYMIGTDETNMYVSCTNQVLQGSQTCH